MQDVCFETTFVIAKRRAYGRSGLATSAILLAPKKNQQNYNWQRYTQQPKQCAASQSHCFSPFMFRGKHPRRFLSSLRARKFLRSIPRGPRAQGAKIEPGQTNLWLRRRSEREGARGAALAGSLGRKSNVFWTQPVIFFPIAQESRQPQAPCRARHQAHNPTPHCKGQLGNAPMSSRMRTTIRMVESISLSPLLFPTH